MGRMEGEMMFEKMLQWLRRTLNRYFEMQGTQTDILLSASMENAISRWAAMYEGEKPKEGSPPIGIAAAISAEFARLVTMELQITASGSERADYIMQQLGGINLQNAVELACALGGVVFKPFASDGKIVIDVIQGDCFFPVAFDTTGRMTSAVFVDQVTREDKIYTRLEKHEFTNGSNRIQSKAFESGNTDTLGKEIPLSSVPEWQDMEPDFTIADCTQPLFSYLKIPFQNTIDRHSPLGVSVFSRAEPLILQADNQFSRYVWEFEGSELAIDAAEDYLRPGPDGAPRLPKGKTRLFRGHETRNQDFYEVFSPAIRDESIRRGFNTMLQRIEFACGLAYGTISDPQTVEKTAEEVRTSKTRTYATVKAIQRSVENALRDLAVSVDTLATLYDYAPQGESALFFDWDDSIVNDPRERKMQFWQYVVAGKFPFWRYLVRFEGYSEADARAIAQETGAALGDPYADAGIS